MAYIEVYLVLMTFTRFNLCRISRHGQFGAAASRYLSAGDDGQEGSAIVQTGSCRVSSSSLPSPRLS